ncbi:MAG: hypothetical protein IJ867_03425 [Clostridia bacterium]|nr:hypothetical protein [Clostridia bacterium]
MSNTIQMKSYKEVLVILDELDLLKEIPNEIIQHMQAKQDRKWNFTFDKNMPIEAQKITRDTAKLLSLLYLGYICNDVDEKEKFNKILEQNEKSAKEQFNINIIRQKVDNSKDEHQIVPCVRESLWQRFISKIKKLFKR